MDVVPVKLDLELTSFAAASSHPLVLILHDTPTLTYMHHDDVFMTAAANGYVDLRA